MVKKGQYWLGLTRDMYSGFLGKSSVWWTFPPTHRICNSLKRQSLYEKPTCIWLDMTFMYLIRSVPNVGPNVSQIYFGCWTLSITPLLISFITYILLNFPVHLSILSMIFVFFHLSAFHIIHPLQLMSILLFTLSICQSLCYLSISPFLRLFSLCLLSETMASIPMGKFILIKCHSYTLTCKRTHKH